jgi:hypothetical protein
MKAAEQNVRFGSGGWVGWGGEAVPHGREAPLHAVDYISTPAATHSGHSAMLLPTYPEVRVRFPTLPDFLRSTGYGTGSTQPREYSGGVNGVICVA